MKARTGWITEKNFRCSSSLQASSLVSAKVETRPCPALLISTWAGPRAARLAAAKACTDWLSSTSQTWASKRASGKRSRNRASALSRRC
ncbi:hypothetical protein D3C76_1765690 [compost metagenome]